MAYGTRDEITIRVRAWTGETWDFSSDRQQFSLSTVAPGGDEVATWSYSALKPYHLPPLASHVEIADQHGIFWVGRIGKPRLAAVHQQADIILTAYGYSDAAGDQRYRQERIFPAGTTIENAVNLARAELVPEISSSLALIAATGRSLNAETRDYRGSTAAQVWGDLIAYGDGGDDPLEWLVWNGGAGTSPVLELKTRPTLAAYTLALSDGATSNDEWDLHELENRISYEWQDASGNPQLTTVTTASTVISGLTGQPVNRDKYVPAGEAVADATDALSLANASLTKFGGVKLSANEITVPDNALILDGGANALPGWRVRAGYLVEITDHKIADGLLSDTRYITHTNYDVDAGTLTITIGDLHGAVRKLKRALQDQSPLAEAARMPGSGITQPAVSLPRFGYTVKRDPVIKPVSLTEDSNAGTGKVIASDEHIHGDTRAWGIGFGDGVSAVTGTPGTPNVAQIFAPAGALAQSIRLGVYPEAAGNASWAVYVNNNLVQQLSGGDAAESVLTPPVIIKEKDALQFRYLGNFAGDTDALQVTCQLIVGKGHTA